MLFYKKNSLTIENERNFKYIKYNKKYSKSSSLTCLYMPSGLQRCAYKEIKMCVGARSK